MTITSDYQEHVEISKKLKVSESFIKAREPYKESFEKIYNEAKEQNVDMSSAKKFLNSLSKEELSSLQNYSLLWDKINVSELNEEGAYNLLLHHYEKYDFNNDGVISDGIATTGSLIPVNMPNDEKEALIETLNEMPNFESFMALSMINAPSVVMYDSGSIGLTQNNTYMDYQAIKDRVNKILNPKPNEYSSPELKLLMSNFLEIFEKKFNQRTEQQEYLKNQNHNDAQITKAKIQYEN